MDISAVVLPNPVGIAEIIFALGLIGCAFWKRGWLRLLLSICIILWGVWAVEFQIIIGAPMIAIGVVLFILALFEVWRGKDLARETVER